MNGILDVLISWLFALLVWAPIGLWIVAKFDGGISDRPIHNFILGTIVGAALNSALLAILSFWFPMHYYINIGFIVINGILFRNAFISGTKELATSIWDWSWLNKIGFLALAAIATICTLHLSLNNDSGLYYIQFIEWMNSYPVVPGLANLHDRFGFNSHWHLLSAAFNVHEQIGTGTNDLNALLFMLIGLGFFDSANRLISKLDLFDLIWVLFPLPLFFLLRFLTSATPDLSSTLIPLVYFSYIVLKREKSSLPILVLIMAFAGTIKVFSALHTLVLIPVLLLVLKSKNYKSLFLALLCGLLITLPWMGRNVVQTGYLVFPLESIDLVNSDWKVPPQLSENARKMVATHARTGSYELREYNAPTSEWFGIWLAARAKPMLALIGGAFVGSILVLMIALVKLTRKKDFELALISIFLSISVILSFAFWWKTGPNPRFIYGTVFFFFAYTGAYLISNINLSKWLRFVPLLALLPMGMITRTVLADKGPKLPTEFSSFKIEGAIISYPTRTDKCWRQELPCTTRERNNLELRGESLIDGFRNSARQ
ncbi:hypothetical protein OAL15_00850 [Flavobacteriales bacterium]|nr:hypothetical protein [Flavobacteriales bacterium]